MTRKNELRCALSGGFLAGATAMTFLANFATPSPLWPALGIPMGIGSFVLLLIAGRSLDKRNAERKS